MAHVPAGVRANTELGMSLEDDIYRTDARRQILNVTVRRIAGHIGWGPWPGCHTERPEGARVSSARLQWCSEVDRGAVGMGQASVLVKPR